VKDQIAAGQFAASQGSWNDLLAFIDTKSGSVASAADPFHP
jgi:serine carboxypeptidase 1